MPENINPILNPNQASTMSNVESGTFQPEPQKGVLADADLDAMFGTGAADEGNKSKPSSDPFKLEDTTGKVQDDPFTQDPVKMARMFQSNYDKTKAELEKTSRQILEEYQPAVEFLHQLYEDKDVRQAFIAELEPELVKPKDPYALIQEALAKEFGADFVPDKEEMDKPGSKTWLYNRRADKIAEKVLESGTQLPKTLKELRSKRQAEVDAKQKETLAEKQGILAEMKWTDATFTGFVDWAQKLKATDLAKMYDRAIVKNTNRSFTPPSLAGQPGGYPVMPNQFKQELDYFFGPDFN